MTVGSGKRRHGLTLAEAANESARDHKDGNGYENK